MSCRRAAGGLRVGGGWIYAGCLDLVAHLRVVVAQGKVVRELEPALLPVLADVSLRRDKTAGAVRQRDTRRGGRGDEKTSLAGARRRISLGCFGLRRSAPGRLACEWAC